MSAELARLVISGDDGEPLTPDEIFRPGTFAYERNILDVARKSGELTGTAYFEKSIDWAERRNDAVEQQHRLNDKDARIYYRAAVPLIVGRIIAATITGGEVRQVINSGQTAPLLTAGLAASYVGVLTIVGRKTANKIKTIESRKPE